MKVISVEIASENPSRHNFNKTNIAFVLLYFCTNTNREFY